MSDSGVYIGIDYRALIDSASRITIARAAAIRHAVITPANNDFANAPIQLLIRNRTSTAISYPFAK